MASLFEQIIGIPVSRERQKEEIRQYLRFRPAETMRVVMSENLSHITQKSGALLAAQAIFIVVDTFGLEHGWPPLAVSISTFLLVLSALIVMTNLRTTYLASPSHIADPAELELESIARTARLAGMRGARFNIALYLTFLSIILLGFGAVESGLS
jgi:hypothetical protein